MLQFATGKYGCRKVRVYPLGGPNGLLPLAHGNRAVTESFGKSEIPGPKPFCDLSRKLPRHGNSDHLMSFKRRSFPRFPFL